MKKNDTTFLMITLVACMIIPTGCDFLDDGDMYTPKTRIAQFTIAPTLKQIVITHPDFPDITHYMNCMIAIEEGTDEPIEIYTIEGLTYEEGYRYKIKMKVISHPRVGDMILTGQRKRDWDNLTPLEFNFNYELVEVLSKTKASD